MIDLPHLANTLVSPLEEWIGGEPVAVESPTYVYQGRCPGSGQMLSLPRTALSQAVARQLLSRLGPPPREGKMLGVLLVDMPGGTGVIFAHSGNFDSQLPLTWVPPIGTAPGRSPLESETLILLEQLKTRLGELAGAPERSRLAQLESHWLAAQEQMQGLHRESKARRDQARPHCDALGLERLNRESRVESCQRRHFKRDREAELAPLRLRVEQIDEEILQVKRQRKQLSRTLQAELHANFGQSLFPGAPWSLASLFPAGPPTGVGECCAPKLLHFAAAHQLRPLAMAEIWWGPTSPGSGRQSGQFYAACAKRCQPLLGPLLSRLTAAPLNILYEDEDLVVVDKPSGVLTVGGRVGWKQDCLHSRLSARYPELRQVHRLDLETSGLVVWARHSRAQAALQRQFEARQVDKLYQALVLGHPLAEQGVINAALAVHPQEPGRYRADPQGKAAITYYRVMQATAEGARLEFRPQTGRSHQLRVHAASILGCPIQGDRLYGNSPGRLMLHAWRLQLTHPDGRTRLDLEAPLPF